MKMTEVWLRVLASDAAAHHAKWKQSLDEKAEEQYIAQAGSASAKQSYDGLPEWIDSAIHPNAFVTILMPVTRTPRYPQFYLSLWTRQAEAALWGKSALHISNLQDRCLWLFAHETVRQDWSNAFGDGKPRKLSHYHALLRMPMCPHQFTGRTRAMGIERKTGRMLPLVERCAVMQRALIEASKRTPEPYASSPLDRLGGADIQVKPYHPNHAHYIFKQLGSRYREHWTERFHPKLLRDHDLFILPHLPR